MIDRRPDNLNDNAASAVRAAASGRGARRWGLTLVELLVSIAIISILAALLLGAASVAGETAREARTKSLVAKLHTLLIERYDSFRNRRVELKPFQDTNAFRSQLVNMGGFALPNNLKPVNEGGDPRVMVLARLAGQRELMKLEMPDRWSDVAGWYTDAFLPPDDTDPLPYVSENDLRARLVFLESLPSLSTVYLRQYNRMVAEGVTAETARENQSAECLYLLIMNSAADGEARSLFKEGDTADTDGDGALEFIDGWGNPISFLRWAPGFDSDAQLSVASLIRSEKKEGLEQVESDILSDHDPFDLFQLDNPDLVAFSSSGSYVGARGWRLVPLIFSNGGDEEAGIRLETDDFETDDLDPGWVATLNPYADVESTTGTQSLGETIDAEAYSDNIDNHQVGALSRSR